MNGRITGATVAIAALLGVTGLAGPAYASGSSPNATADSVTAARTAAASADAQRSVFDSHQTAPVRNSLAERQRGKHQLDHLDKFWARFGVSSIKRAALARKVKAGQILDSTTKKTPLHSEERDVGAFHQTIDTYADGSIRVAEVQTLPAIIADPSDMGSDGQIIAGRLGAAAPTASVTSCHYQSGSGYSNATNCLVRGTTGSITNWFYANYTLVQGSHNDQLTSTTNPGQTCVWPWTCSLPRRSAYVKQETTYTKAGATYTGTRQSAIGSGTQYLNVQVGDDSVKAWFTVP